MPGGRPTVYKPENAEIARRACMLGATNEILGARFEVTRRTVDTWIATIPEFGEAVREGRQIADETVVAALYARAIGIERKTIKVVSGGAGEPVTTTHTVEVPPDVRACIFWLRNRRPEQWRENRPPADEDDGYAFGQELEAAAERARLGSVEEADAVLRDQAERLRVYP